MRKNLNKNFGIATLLATLILSISFVYASYDSHILNSATQSGFSTYIGSSGADYSRSIVSTNESIWIISEIAGHVEGVQGYVGARDILVQQYFMNGTIKNATIFGGTADDFPVIARALGKNIIIAGLTRSTNFPTTANAFDVSANGNRDVFITIIAQNMSIIYSSYIGGSGDDYLSDLVITDTEIIIAGYTTSANFPTTAHCFSRVYNNNTDSFVCILPIDLTHLSYSTYIGGNSQDIARNIAAKDNLIYVVGNTYSADFPRINTMNNYSADSDIFVAIFQNRVLVRTEIFPGNGTDIPTGIAMTPLNEIYIAGYTNSANLINYSRALKPVIQGYDGFIMKMNLNLSLKFATYIGDSGSDYITNLLVDENGVPIMGGYTSSANLQTTPGAFQRLYSAGNDAFVMALSINGEKIIFSTFLGGTGAELLSQIQLINTNSLAIVGSTTSTNFPVWNAHQMSNMGGYDGFISMIPYVPIINESLPPTNDSHPPPTNNNTTNDTTDNDEFKLEIPEWLKSIAKPMLIILVTTIGIALIYDSAVKINKKIKK